MRAINSAAVFLFWCAALGTTVVSGCQSPPAPAAGSGSASDQQSAGAICSEGSGCAEGTGDALPTVRAGSGAAETAAAAADGDPAGATGTPEPEQPAPAAARAPLLPAGWASVAEGDLTPDEVARAERAAAAMRSVGGQMMQRVVTVASEQGYPAAIEVCSNEAVGFAQAAQEEFDLRIGRTSTRLRNPGNEVPLWAAPHISAQATASAPMGEFLRGPEGQLGVLKPIMLGAVCANCHGTPDVLATGVQEALALRYPRDQAIGYREGELRGWFWMEVAAN